ncbi:alpha/beta hydrolase family protein [Kribbella voronezhensis]|uniref:Alpha/beta hydrolase family protein n=1 Tax=Kribbella voronezhensis TaxID=2512212 RepID=A0A4R7SXH3_9ACTN|nr:alpha/beta hydrolase family protein [Kribbella voronezhensis]
MNDGVDALLGELRVRAGVARGSVSRAGRLGFLRSLVDPFERLSEPELSVVERVPCDGYRRDRVELEVLPGIRFGAYVLVPDGIRAPSPGVLAVHGHGYGSRQIIGLGADDSSDADGNDLYGRFAVQLVRRGLVVIAPDVVGFGERMTDVDRAYDSAAPSSCYRLSMELMMSGYTLTGLRIAELLGVLDAVAAHPDIDRDRIGIFGHSGGSLWSMIAMALDERIRAGVLCGFANTFADSFLAVHHCACNFVPGLLTVAEQPDLLALLAPRPLFLESGAEDPIFPASGFRSAVESVSAVYTDLEAADCFRSDLVPGVEHAVSGRLSYDWLAETLTGPGTAPTL